MSDFYGTFVEATPILCLRSLFQSPKQPFFSELVLFGEKLNGFRYKNPPPVIRALNFAECDLAFEPSSVKDLGIFFSSNTYWHFYVKERVPNCYEKVFISSGIYLQLLIHPPKLEF